MEDGAWLLRRVEVTTIDRHPTGQRIDTRRALSCGDVIRRARGLRLERSHTKRVPVVAAARPAGGPLVVTPIGGRRE